MLHALVSTLIRALSFLLDRAWISYLTVLVAIVLPKIDVIGLPMETLYITALTLVVLLMKEILIRNFNADNTKPLKTRPIRMDPNIK